MNRAAVGAAAPRAGGVLSARSPVASAVALVGGALMLAGCQTMSLTQSETADSPGHVAHVYVAAYPPVPWSAIQAKLSPANNLTIEQARAMVSAPTQAETAQFLSSFAAGLNLSIVPPSAGTPTVSATGLPTAGLPASAPTADFTKIPPPLAINGGALLQEGTALFQRAQILDNQIANQVLPAGYRPFLLTFQFDVQPHQGNLDYDAYTDVTLVPEDISKRLTYAGRPPIRIFPVIISDTMEITSVGRSVEALQQAQASLTAILAHVGGAGSVGRSSDKAATILGPDRNSLVTAGRVTDNTVRIRFGATNSGRAGRAITPETYNISFLILVDSSNPGPGGLDSLAAVTHTSFKDFHGRPPTGDGSDEYRDVLAERVCDALHGYALAVHDQFCPAGRDAQGRYPKGSFASDGAKDRALDLLRHVDRQRYDELAPAAAGPDADIKLQRLVAELQMLQVRQKYGEVSIPLPSWAPALPDGRQVALFADDGKQAATVALRGGRDLEVRQIRAWLSLGDGAGGGSAVLPTAVGVGANGTEIDLTFPSAALVFQPTHGVPARTRPKGAPVVPPATFDGPSLTVTLRDDRLPVTAQPVSAVYTVRTVKPVPGTPATAANPVQVTSSTLIPDADGRAQLTLHVGAVKDASVVGGLHLVVAGGDVRSDVAGALAPSAKVKGVDVTQNTTPVLVLGDLAPGQSVTLQTIDDAAPAQTTYGAPIVLTVGAGAPRK